MQRKLLPGVLTAVPLLVATVLGVWLAQLPAQEHQVAAFATGLRGRTRSQVHNVRLAAAGLDGRVIPPGEAFSFNKAVGPWTMDRGYVRAPVSFSGDKTLDWGGGVCQAATSLYNAALLAGVSIEQRSRHHWPATYVPAGQDAAVAFPSIDLRFRNTLRSPIRISARVEGDALVVRLLSRAVAPRIRLERRVLSVTRPAILARSRAGGLHRASQRGQPGCQVALYRTFIGEPSRRELVSRDTYPPQNRIIWR